MVRVLVCGGRTFGEPMKNRHLATHEEREADMARVSRQRDLIKRTLYDLCDEYGCWQAPDQYGNQLPGDITIIHGAAKGADRIADEWAVVNWVQIEEYPAQWDMYGKRAGFLRNLQMIVEGKPDVVVAFPGGPGTANMVKQAHAYRIRVIEIKDTE